MNLLDENFPEDQRPQLRHSGIQFRQIGRDFAQLGVKDQDIIPLLHRHRRVTFFTQDKDFFNPALCHAAYCLVWLETRADETAHYVRQFLRHPRFDTEAKRLGNVVRVHHDGIHFWQLNKAALQRLEWSQER